MNKTGIILITGLLLPAMASADFFSALTQGAGGNGQQEANQSTNDKQGAANSQTTEVRSTSPFGSSYVTYKGYAKQFLPVKQLIYKGGLEDAAAFYESGGEKELEPVDQSWYGEDPDGLDDTESEAIDLGNEDLRFINMLELGTLKLDSGNYSEAVSKLQEAQQMLEKREDEGKVKSGISSLWGTVSSVAGFGEAGRYEGESYEKVLMLNYQSLGYLMQGNRGAYNVARRAMDWQRLEQEKFTARLAETTKELADKKTEAAEGQKDNYAQVSEKYERYEEKAKRVASAYVNPFGWYVSGLIQEYESYQDPSLWTNAMGAYQKALDLNKNNKALQKLVNKMKKRRGPKKKPKLIHIVVSDGFAPEKKVLVNQIALPQASIKVELPIYEPVDNKVDKIVVQSSKGKKLATLSTIADIESIALRHQMDSKPMRELAVALSTVRGAVQSQALSQTAFGGLFQAGLEQVQTPDTRSWMSLPARIMGERMHLKKSVNAIQLVSYDKGGKELSRQKISLNGDGHNFIYARSINGKLYFHVAEKLWI